jgi:hypothetical protein
VASLTRACSHCGSTFEAKTSRAVFCSGSCRALASKARAHAEQAGRGKVINLPGAASAPTNSIEATTLTELGGQASTSTGRQALLIARRLDAGVSDSALAGMSRRFDELLAEAGRQEALASSKGDDTENPIAFLVKRAEDREAAARDDRSAG